MHVPKIYALSFSSALIALGSLLTACDGGGSGTGGAGGTTSAGGAGGSGGAPLGPPYEPQGCSFKVAQRPEYTDWSVGKTDTAANPNIRRVRLGLGGNVAVGAAGRADPATSAGFVWQTDDGTLASEVTWGSSPDPATWPAENRASGVTWLTPPGIINGTDPERMHEVYICGLTPATTYYYRVGGGPAGSEVWSDVHAFTTTPKGPATDVTIFVAGDSRGQDNAAWPTLQKKVMLAGATMQLYTGDAVLFGPDQAEWELFFDSFWKDSEGNLSTSGQVLTVMAHGNHENYSTLFFGNVALPQDVDNHPEYAELFFSFDVGPAHIVVIDDERIAVPTLDPAYSEVLTAWLDADLSAANANRANVPWIIASHHHGELSSSNHGDDEDVLNVRKFLMPIWDKYHVDLVVDGHDHNYERSKIVTGPAEMPTVMTEPKDGTMYLVCAGTGAPAYSPGTSDFTDFSAGYKDSGAIGLYGILRISQTELTIEGYELRSDGSDPMIDTYTLTK